MAQENALQRKEESTDLNPFADYTPEELDAIAGTTGTEDSPPEDRRHPLYVFNVDTVDESGNEIKPNLFWDTQSGKQYERVRCSLLGFKQYYILEHLDPATAKNVRDCVSLDRTTGIDVEGKMYSCDRCEHRKAKKGVRKACTVVFRFVGWDLDRDQLFVLTAKRTSFIPVSRYLERNFYGKYYNPKTRKKGDLPLYIYETIFTLKLEMGIKKYYVLQPERGNVLPREIVMGLLPMAQKVKKMAASSIVDADKDQVATEDQGEHQNYGDDEIPF